MDANLREIHTSHHFCALDARGGRDGGGGGGIDEEDKLELLGRVGDKSLVLAESSGEGWVRYRMLEPIRQYARQTLAASGKADEVQGRHAAFFLALAEEAEPELSGPQQGLWVEREHDNLRAALS